MIAEKQKSPSSQGRLGDLQATVFQRFYFKRIMFGRLLCVAFQNK